MKDGASGVPKNVSIAKVQIANTNVLAVEIGRCVVAGVCSLDTVSYTCIE